MPIFSHRRHQAGFTLLEIAIVLIITGLIAASVTAGRHLIKQAELKAIIQSVDNYNTAIHIFRDKYYSWPGDMPNATNFWTATTNGNGDDQIIGTSGGPNQNEGYRAWQQLSLAEMIKESFDGLGRGSGNEAIIGENVPKSPRERGGYFLHYWGIADKGNALNFGAFQADTYNFDTVLSPDDAYHIDGKMDDGLPRSGDVWAGGDGGAGNCYTASAYNLTETTIQCAMMFWFDEQ